MSSSHTPAPNQVVFTCVQRKSRFSANAYQLPPRARRSLRRERLSQSTHSVCGLGQSLGRRAPGSARGRHRTLRGLRKRQRRPWPPAHCPPISPDLLTR